MGPAYAPANFDMESDYLEAHATYQHFLELGLHPTHSYSSQLRPVRDLKAEL